jgi:hypothetical protein
VVKEVTWCNLQELSFSRLPCWCVIQFIFFLLFFDLPSSSTSFSRNPCANRLTDGTRVMHKRRYSHRKETHRSISYPKPSHRQGKPSENHRGWDGGRLLYQRSAATLSKYLEKRRKKKLVDSLGSLNYHGYLPRGRPSLHTYERGIRDDFDTHAATSDFTLKNLSIPKDIVSTHSPRAKVKAKGTLGVFGISCYPFFFF